MRRVIASEFVSLDGVMEDPGGAEGFEHGGWAIQLGSEEQERFKFDELSAVGALLFGRATEGFAAAWPHMMDAYEGPRRAELQQYADMMNGYPRYVVSSTLEEPLEWSNSTLIKGNVAEEVSRLKQQPGKDILVFGSAGQYVAGARTYRRVAPHSLPRRPGEREASFHGWYRYNRSEACGDEEVRASLFSPTSQQQRKRRNMWQCRERRLP